ncbi:MAG: DUF4625 domain-containing protein [Sphingobacterium sp.]
MIVAFLLLAATFNACKKDREEYVPEKAEPTIENLELGLSNSGFGVIGRDFHFQADILAGDKIDRVEVQIQQKEGETYAKQWGYNIIWEQYRGVKNTTVHKNFDIPADAIEGKYDLYVHVYDQNGTKLEMRNDFTIYIAKKLPVDPQLTVFNLQQNGQATNILRGDKLPIFKKDDIFKLQATISGVKGDGKTYLLLIKNSLKHFPETIEQIDFDKAIVYDVFEHRDEANVYDFSNYVSNRETYLVVRGIPDLAIGAEKDNNVPSAPATGLKSWSSGEYSLVVIYKNTTYNMTYFRSEPIIIEY